MAEDAPARKNPAVLIFRIVLLVVLFVLLAAFAYEYAYSRRQPSMLIKELDALVANAEQGADPITPDDIKEMAGFAPQETKEVRTGSMLEVYVWRGGLIVTSNKLYVLYEKSPDGEWVYEVCQLNEDPTGGS